MHVLAVNSVTTLLNYLKEQIQNTPTLSQIEGREEDEDDKDEDKVSFMKKRLFPQI